MSPEINSNIPLSGKPVVVPNALEQYSQIQALKTQQQNQLVQQQQMLLQQKQGQALDLENQQRQMEIERVRVNNNAYKVGLGQMNPDGSAVAAPSTAATPASPAQGASAPAQATTPPNALVAPASTVPDDDANPDDGGHGGPSAVPNALVQPPVPRAVPPSIAPRAAAPGATLATVPPAAGASGSTSAPGSPALTNGFDFDKMARYLAANGQGSQILPLRVQQTEYAQKLALQQKTQAEAHTLQVQQVAQAFQGINSAPADQKEAALQQALATAVPLAKQYGMDTSSFPQHYDPASTPTWVNQGVAHAASLVDFSKQAQEAADLQFRMSQGLPKTAKEIEEQYNSDISQTQNPDDLTRKNEKWDAIAKTDPTGTMGKVLGAVKVSTWTPSTSTDATLSSLKPDERVAFFTKRLDDASQRLKSAALVGPQQYAQELQRQSLKAPEISGLFPAAPKAGEPWDGKAVATQAASVGTTGEQYITAQNMAQYKEELIGLRGQMLGIQQQKADQQGATANDKAFEVINKERDATETKIKANYTKLATAAIKGSGYNTPDDALADSWKTLRKPGDPVSPNTLSKDDYKAIQSVKNLKANAAPLLQGAHDRWAAGGRKLGASGVVDQNVDKDWNYTPRDDSAPAPVSKTTSTAPGGGSVQMKAPDGTVSSVNSSQVEYYKSLGATVVK